MLRKWDCQVKPGYFSRFNKNVILELRLQPVDLAVFSRRFSGLNLEKCSG